MRTHKKILAPKAFRISPPLRKRSAPRLGLDARTRQGCDACTPAERRALLLCCARRGALAPCGAVPHPKRRAGGGAVRSAGVHPS